MGYNLENSVIFVYIYYTKILENTESGGEEMNSLTKYWWIVLIYFFIGLKFDTVKIVEAANNIEIKNIDVNNDGKKEKIQIKYLSGMTANISIIDSQGKELFPYYKNNSSGNIPCGLNNYLFKDGKLYFLSGRISYNYKDSFIDILVFSFDEEMRLFVEEKNVHVRFCNKNDNNTKYAYEYAEKNKGEDMHLRRNIHKILYYIRNNKKEEAEKYFSKGSNFHNYYNYENYRKILSGKYAIIEDRGSSITIQFSDKSNTRFIFVYDVYGKMEIVINQDR